MGLQPQLKRAPSCSVEKHWASLVCSVRGACISETARLAIIEVCSVIPRGVTQMRRLRGQIQSGLLGFDMNIDSMPAFVKFMLPINDAVTATESSGKFIWLKLLVIIYLYLYMYLYVLMKITINSSRECKRR